jgi:glycosyltransferase involved in cell wall biosynthesis
LLHSASGLNASSSRSPAATSRHLHSGDGGSNDMTNKTILFVSHDAYRAGATNVLITLLQWLKANTDLRFDVLLRQHGELAVEFEKLARVWWLVPRVGARTILRDAQRRWFGNDTGPNIVTMPTLASQLRRSAEFGLIYSNTVANGRVLEALSPLGCPVVTHVHELEHSIRTHAAADFVHVKRRTTHYVAAAAAVKDHLQVGHGIAADMIDCVHEFVPTAAAAVVSVAAARRAVRQEIGIPEAARIVGACGTVDWRKGCDVFVQLATTIKARQSDLPVHFVWLGAHPGADRLAEIHHDLERTALADRVHFIGARPNPLDYLAAFDILALVSREDPFPLVVLESAALGIPTVCFDNAGGIPEFVEHDAGRIVPYLDTGAMADCIIELLRHEETRAMLGQCARFKVRDRHDVSIAGPKILKILKRMLSPGQPRNTRRSTLLERASGRLA